MEVRCARGYEADGCGETGQEYDDCQEEGTAITEEDLSAKGQNRSTCFLHANGLYGLGT